MERMGHAQIQTTQKYLHTLPEADQKNLDALNRITGPRRLTCRALPQHQLRRQAKTASALALASLRPRWQRPSGG
jgi:hypothetical protein